MDTPYNFLRSKKHLRFEIERRRKPDAVKVGRVIHIAGVNHTIKITDPPHHLAMMAPRPSYFPAQKYHVDIADAGGRGGDKTAGPY
jgi:hypothetical protein